jgi:hypothetical protein
LDSGHLQEFHGNKADGEFFDLATSATLYMVDVVLILLNAD